MPDAPTKSMDDIMALCKRRGFIFQASEIYGGINGFWDYGPLGSQLKKNLRDAWWDDVVMTGCRGQRGPDGNPVRIVPVDTCIIQNPRVWEASGHVAGFNDPMVDDKETKGRFRADHLMGLYPIPAEYGEGEDEPGIGPAQRAADRAEALGVPKGILPRFTIVASTAGEAAMELLYTKGYQKAFGFKEVTQEFLDGGIPFIVAKTSRGIEYYLIKPVAELDARASEIPSPFSQKPGALTVPRAFNLMFDTITGAIRDEANKAYLRPETAQGIFINYKNVLDSTRVKVPFGIAQTGKAFRNEVTPRNFTFRSREFEQMEIEFFCHPDSAREWYTFWRDWRMQWWKDLGLAGANLILREHDRDELAHYAKEGAGTSDVEYRFPFTAPGYGELEGIAHRTDFDLRQHQQFSGAKLEYFDQERNERYLPHVIEPSAGLDRGVLAAICEAFTPDPNRPSGVFMKFHPRLSPIKAAVFPLVNKDGMPEVGERLHAELARKFAREGLIELDAKQSIGKRYARMDEAGCPFCFTIDGDTLTDQSVTVRHRDTLAQERVALDAVPGFLADRLGG